jgi:hypothetical protein
MTNIIFQQYLTQFNNHVGRKVLLIIDNAPSHVWENLNLPNLEIIALPPNTISKLQPLDAGIIAAFKRHYRKRQLNWALDQLDVGKNPFKVDQLTAMKWVNAAWNTLSQSTFQNCWRHTDLISNSVTPDISYESEIASAEYDYILQQLNIRDAMSLEDFLNPSEEETVFTHEMLTDEDIIEMVQHVEEDEEQEMAEEEISNPVINLPLEEQAKVLGKTMAVLEMHNNTEIEKAIEVLRQVQRNIRWNAIKEIEERRVQRSLTDFLERRKD